MCVLIRKLRRIIDYTLAFGLSEEEREGTEAQGLQLSTSGATGSVGGCMYTFNKYRSICRYGFFHPYSKQ